MKNMSRVTLPLLATLLATSPAYAASDQDIAALKAEIARLSDKVAALEASPSKPAQHKHGKGQKHGNSSVPASTVSTESSAQKASPAAIESAKKTVDLGMAGSFPGAFRVPGTDTSLKIGGFVKADMIADVGSGYGSPYAKFYAIPLETSSQSDQSWQTTFGAQQTRLNLESRTPTSLGELKAFVEIDFYGSNAGNSNTNGYGVQLRHAYGQLGGLLAGQTWSNFMDTTSMPESLDYVGPAASVFVRQSQLRYTHTLGDVALSASVESAIGNNSSSNTQRAVTYVGTERTARSELPDIVLRADYKYTPKSYVAVRALVNEINVDRTVSGTKNASVTEYGYGLAVGGKQAVFEKDSLVYDFVYGEGTGRYLLDIGAAGNYYNSTANKLDMASYYTGKLGYQHVWSPELRTNVFGGYVRVLNDTSFSGASANQSVASGHINLIWQPAPAYKVGLEYMHGYRKTQGSTEGNLDRLQTSFSYSF